MKRRTRRNSKLKNRGKKGGTDSVKLVATKHVWAKKRRSELRKEKEKTEGKWESKGRNCKRAVMNLTEHDDKSLKKRI